MLVLISPAKRLDFQTPSPTRKHSLPGFLEESKTLIKTLRTLGPGEIADLMHISTDLADLNYQRYADWQPPFDKNNAKPAVFAFKGDVYLGLEADNLSARDITWMQKRVRILSGLYGVLKPLDLIQAYRLEMGTALKTERGNDLYSFWGNTLTDAINAELAQQSKPVLINLASQEYYASVNEDALDARVITPTFKDLKNGKYRFMSFLATKARGQMVRYMVENRVNTLKALKEFDVGGYYFSKEQSHGDRWVFLRDKPE
jgi:cytoplasmic iron level regulating protein YaaA (DUF328/UPF0246 family)